MGALRRAAGVALGAAICLSTPAAIGSRLGIGGESGNPFDCSDCHFGASGARVEILDAIGGSITSSFVYPNQTRPFRFLVIGGPGIICGFNISADGGTLIPSGTDVRYADFPFSAELTHSMPNNFDAGFPVCEFDFEWTAPPTTGAFTIYGAGNSANDDHTAAGDAIADTRHSVVVPEPGGVLAAWLSLATVGWLRFAMKGRPLRR